MWRVCLVREMVCGKKGFTGVQHSPRIEFVKHSLNTEFVVCRVSSETSSYRNNRNWNRNKFWHYPKQDICFGCFALISKQGVSVFRNNRNKQKTNWNSSKFFKISTFLIPHTISSVCFGYFDTGPKHRNKLDKIFLVSWKSKPKNNQNRLSFGCFGSNQEIKFTVLRTPLIENVFWRFFRFISRKFCLFQLFLYRSETPKQTETNRKKCFLVLWNKPKNNRNRLSFGLFRFKPKKKFDCFEEWCVNTVPDGCVNKNM
jgi:hypothetical protein